MSTAEIVSIALFAALTLVWLLYLVSKRQAEEIQRQRGRNVAVLLVLLELSRHERNSP